MARRKDDAKRDAIRDATVEVVVEGGVSGAAIAKIATRAQVSAGTIYLYYPDKDALLQQIYLSVKTEIYQQALSVHDDAESAATNIRRMWFAFINHLLTNPHDYLFAEFVSAAQAVDMETLHKVSPLRDEVHAILYEAIEDGTLVNTSTTTIKALLLAPAKHLARLAVSGNREITQEEIGEIFTMIWRAIAAAPETRLAG